MSTSSEQLPQQPAPPVWPLYPEPEPVFGMIEVVGAFLGILVTVIFCGAVAILIAHHLQAFKSVPMKELANHPSVLIPAQLAAYLLLFAVLARLFHHHYRIPMFQALSWSWPARWPLFLASGVLLALAAEAVSHFLPTPPEMPIDKMLRTPSDAWMLAFFGVLIAPFVEELLFRGLLFPALIRRVGLPASLVTTAVLFGVVHAQQLAGAWIQISCIVAVGIVLTVVRWRAHSLACSTLVHVGYNGALFTALFIETQAFTNFSVK